MGLFDKNVTRNGKGLFGVDDPYSVDNLDRQISNATTRIQDAGYTPANADSRNGFEKWTNLPQGQNWFFDTLEILGRPGNAVKNVINYGLDGSDDTGSAIYKGLSGQEKVSGADLAQKIGVENKVGKFALGLGLDIGLDPTTYIPGGVIAKGVKGGAGLAAAPIKAGYNALESASPALKTFRETRVAPAAESFKDGLGYMFKSGYKIDETLTGGKSDFLKNLDQQTENSRRYMQEATLEGLGKTARDAGGIDAGVDVGRILEDPLRQFQDVKGYEFPDGLTRTTDKKDLLSTANANRETIRSLGKEVNATRREYDTGISQTASELEKVDNKLRRMFDSTERKKLKTLVGGQPIQEGLSVKRGFTSQSPVINLLQQKSDEVASQMAAAKLEQGTQKFRKTTYTPEKIQQLATSRAFKSLSPSPAFNYLVQRRDELKNALDGLRAESKQAKSGNIEQIQKLVDDNAALKESSRNPVMIQQEIPRTQRELSTDPKIQQAAQKLMGNNATIRQFAEQNGISIPELEGYMTHVWSQEERARRTRISPVDRGSRGTGDPNKSILNTRTLTGSAEDVNDKLKRKFFEPNAFYASAIGQKRLVDYVHAVKFRREVLSNREFAIPFKKGQDVPKGAEVIDTNNYKFLKDSGDLLDGMKLADEVGGQYVVTKQAKQLLDRYQRVNTDEGTKNFLKAFDTIQSFWKRGALFSLGYHVRNQAGAMFNNYVGGMNPADLGKYTIEGFQEVARSVAGKESKLFNEYRQQGLSSTALSQVEFAKYGEEPEKAIEKTVKNLSKDAKGQVTQRLNPMNAFQTSQEVGNFFDQANRFALYKWARDKGMNAEQAASKVREVQFDYSKLTPFEQNVVARAFPFYRWMKNNIPFQIRQFVNDPRKYEYLNKARINAQDVVGLDENNIPDYMKEQFSIPITGDQGKGKMLGLNLPLGDLTKLSKPGKTLVDAFTPILKTPTELALNYNMFRGKPIQEFAGQKKQYVGGGELPVKLAYGLEQATGQIGRGLSGFLQKPESANQDTLNRLPSLGISSLTKDFDAEKYSYYEKLNELKQMQDLILFIQQQEGQKPRTLNEIKKTVR